MASTGEHDDTSNEEAVARLLDLLELEELDINLYRGHNPDTWPGGRVFGGLVAAQALRAATRAVEVEHLPHSLHAYFLRPGKPGVPIIFTVDRVRDGKSFTTRTVTASQRGETIFTMSASFNRPAEGETDYQLPLPADVPRPDELEAFSGMPVRPSFFSPFDLRDIGPTEPEADGTYRSTRRAWVRTTAALPDDPVLNACALAFMSDMAVVVAARPPVAGRHPWEGYTGASLDHAVWFHRPVRADHWMLYDLHSVSFVAGRGLARGTFHDIDGRLVASVAQEALIRPLPPGAPSPVPQPPPPEL